MIYQTANGEKDIQVNDLIMVVEEYRPENREYFVVFDVSQVAVGVRLLDGSAAYIQSTLITKVYHEI